MAVELPGAREITYDVVNTFHQDSFKVSFSNFPVILETETLSGINQPIDMRIFDYYVKNVTIPDQSLQVTEIPMLNRVQLQPISRGNDNLNSVTVEFKVDNAFRNYFMFYTYIRQMRTAEPDVDVFYKNVIHEMFVDAHANVGEKMVRLKFTNLFPISTGTLSLESGASQELTFAVSFVYEEFTVEMIDQHN